jgi:integrase
MVYSSAMKSPLPAQAPTPFIVPKRTKKRKINRNANGEGSLFQRGQVWYWTVRWNGERLVFSTGTRLKSEAIEWRSNKLVEMRTGVNPATAKRKTGAITVNELLDDYVAHLRAKGRSSANIVECVLNARIRPAFGTRTASSINTTDSLVYRKKMRAEKIKDTTINRHLASFHAALVHAFRRQTPRKLDVVPYFEMADESNNVRTGFIERDGYLKIRAALPNSLKPLFVCGYHVSTRKGELLKIKWPMVDFQEGIIELEPRSTKNREGRYLPIYGDMGETLRKQKELRDRDYPDTEHVFFWHRDDVTIGHGGTRTIPGGPLKKFYKSWDDAVVRAGYPDFLFHDLRRSAQRNMRKAGIDQSIRKKISGHKTDSMERRYNILDVADIKEAGKRMEEWAAKI